VHLDIEKGCNMEVIFDRYFWRYMNHSCNPNVRIQGHEVVAIRQIKVWEPVTFNYNSTEWEIAEPFTCHCGSTDCLELIRGYKYLRPAQRERLEPLVAPHVKRAAAKEHLPATALHSV
jgi:hypothetical protein